MEFTYDGFVRHGFGFFNPNHAAAFLSALLPFALALAASKKLPARLCGLLFAFALIAAAAFTYSRAGILVIVIDILAFAAYRGRANLKAFISLLAVFFAAIFFTGAFSRFSYDAASANRLEIWKSGLMLFAQNPFGVGFGNSGEIVSAFILDDGISCRTLVNSHLTLACEFGVFVFEAYLAAIFYALICGAKNSKKSVWIFAAFVAFSGFLVSAAFSSIFDFEVLFYPERFDWLSNINIFCQWLNFLLFAGLGAFLIFGGFCKRTLVFSAFAAAASISCVCAFAPKADVKIVYEGGEVFAGSQNPSSAAFFDDEYSLKSAVKILRKLNLLSGTAVCVNSAQNKETLPRLKGAKTVILFGREADFMNRECAGDCEYVLISPPPYISLSTNPPNAIFLPKSSKKYANLREKYGRVKDF